MLKTIEIRPLNPEAIASTDLAKQADQEGYSFVARLISEAKDGRNRFDKEGECFHGAFFEGALVGCGGLNQDPYTEQHFGRIRHVYVVPGFRRHGVAGMLVKDLLVRSRSSFDVVRLRTSGPHADKFYENFGFARTDAANVSHILKWR